MKTGIIRRIDDLGRVVVPKEIRRMLQIREGDPLEISLEGKKIVFELYLPANDYEDCIFRLIDEIKNDEFISTGKNEAISALKEAYNALCSTEKGGVQE